MSAAVKHDDGDPAVRTTKVSSKNQITLPVAALTAAHVRAGDVLKVEVEEDGVFRLTRVRDPFWDAFHELAGSAPGLAEAANLEELRDEWER
jgi:bifunctional DNA-binding transcriptional regulator/antitoxin component of YhaV-PrlF toxin-antitoxin module